MKLLFKILYIIISLICIWLMWYFYIYQWFFKPSIEVKEKVIYKDIVKEEVINEEDFNLISWLIKPYYKKNSSIKDWPQNFILSKYLTEFSDNKKWINIEAGIRVNSPEQFNDIFANIFPYLIRKEYNRAIEINPLFLAQDVLFINAKQKSRNYFEIDIKVQRKNEIIFEWKFYFNKSTNKVYIQEIKNINLLLNNINQNGYKRFLNNSFEVDYSTLKFLKIKEKNNINFDLNFGISKYDAFKNILENIENFVLDYNKKYFSNWDNITIKLNQDIKPIIISQIFNNNNTTSWQKQNINDKLNDFIKSLEWTTLSLNKEQISLTNRTNKFIFGIDLYIKKDIEIDNLLKDWDFEILSDIEEFKEEKRTDIMNNFVKNNEMLLLYLNDMSLAEIINH